MQLSLCVALSTLLGAVPAPITAVTVYSDQARVTRTAELTLSGTLVLELPPLPDTVDTSSIRVEASGAEVRRVDISPLRDEELPADEARKLLTELEKLDDELSRVHGELQALQTHQGSLQRLQPSLPEGKPQESPPRLDASGWGAAMTFSTQQLARVQTLLREREEQIRVLTRKRERLAEDAQRLGGARRREGWKVSATVAGEGAAKVRLLYRVGRARWYPVYELQLAPEARQVELSFAGLVSHESGEDWTDATLTLSTAVPATATKAPKLLSWKIGDKERFIPTPRLRAQPSPLPPPPAPPPSPGTSESEALQARLLARLGTGPQGTAVQTGAAEYERHPQRPSPPPPPPPAPRRRMSRAESSGPAPSAMAPAAPAEPEMPYEESMEESTVASESITVSRSPRSQVPELGLSLSPPPGYQPRQYDPNLPVSLAGGHALSFRSLRAESIPSGKGARRVALLSERWPVEVERKVFPALAPHAFLVAELRSPSQHVLPGGSASLFVGADPAGTAVLKPVSPGEAFTLPLGVDRALKPLRQVSLVQADKGLLGQQEESEYRVTIELANPYAFPAPVRIIDQWPLSHDERVEVKLLETKPSALQDAQKGSLEWRLTLPPSGRSEVSFTYSIRRPKGWRLFQK